MILRWLFFALLVANLLLFLWGNQRPRPGDAVTDDLPRSSGVPSIALLSELAPETVMSPTGENAGEVASDFPVLTDPAGRIAPGPAESDRAAGADAPVAQRTCIRLGPLHRHDQAFSISSDLGRKGVDSSVAVEAQQTRKGYWVLLDADPARKDEVLGRLRASGIQDTWYFSQGELADAISFGLYSDRDRSDARAQELTGLGFEARVEARTIESFAYWVEVRYAVQPEDFNTTLEAVYEATPGLVFPPASCPDVVTSTSIP